jgi:hypothetical protein
LFPLTAQEEDKEYDREKESLVSFGGAWERRESSRFPLQENVQYRLVNSRDQNGVGSGRTLDMSSSGISFTTEAPLPPGCLLELAVDWPARLDGTCPLRLVAVGRVVRASRASAAVRIVRYEFRTRRSVLAVNA